MDIKYWFQTLGHFMKKLLLAFIVLSSFTVFAQDEGVQSYNANSIRVSNDRDNYRVTEFDSGKVLCTGKIRYYDGIDPLSDSRQVIRNAYSSNQLVMVDFEKCHVKYYVVKSESEEIKDEIIKMKEEIRELREQVKNIRNE
jgi:hypothetical protein